MMMAMKKEELLGLLDIVFDSGGSGSSGGKGKMWVLC